MGKTKKEAKEKPLDKMTAKELREVAMTIPEIVGVHGMNKNELISAVKKARGIAEETAKSASSTSVRSNSRSKSSKHSAPRPSKTMTPARRPSTVAGSAG